MSKKRKMAAASMINTKRDRVVSILITATIYVGNRPTVAAVVTSPRRQRVGRPFKICYHHHFNAFDIYNKHNPSPATHTKIDVMHDNRINYLPKLDLVRTANDNRIKNEIIMILQFVMNFILKYHCTGSLS